ncbi:MAG: alkaline phosphatase family protein [Phycisphaerales bacterium]|nr:MAG: alkaline phosphatase family protein [Phycisphaerales bacterium]
MRAGFQLASTIAVSIALLVTTASCRDEPAAARRVFVLGMDGMDPQVLEPLLAAGRMPNFAKLAAAGGYKSLGTSIPPQSPCAWSNVITGCDARVHNIFDFIHRDPKTLQPYQSTSTTGDTAFSIQLSKWNIPLWGGEGTVLLRRGTPFWEYLTEAGVPATVFRMPTQYPPGESKGAELISLTGMGTPDLLGGYGQFSYFSSNPATARKTVSGGRIYPLKRKSRDSTAGELIGPPNPMLHVEEGEQPDELAIPFTVDRDPEYPVVRVGIQGRTILLKEGQWSDWTRLSFDTGIPGESVLPGGTMPAACRFYLKAARPYIEVYVTPLQMDPIESSEQLGTPGDFARQLAEDTGPFYTQGIPEDHSALSEGALNRDQYLEQAELVLSERMRHLDYMLEHYKGGFFFFYFGSTDQVAHVFWSEMDPGHVEYDADVAEKYGQVINRVYERVDEALGRVMEVARPEDTLIVMSDHGFNDFSRGFNLNTWLLQNGYLALKGNFPQDKYEGFVDVDWSATRAYNLGINCLYVNLKGRERDGVVESHERDALLAELAAKLEQVVDPQTGQRVIARAYRVDEIFPAADPDIAPDIIVGYNRGYRASWGTILGKMPHELIETNTNRWSGDHCVAAHLVPGIIVANRPMKVDDADLLDLAPTILAEYDIPKPEQMHGRNLFGD